MISVTINPTIGRSRNFLWRPLVRLLFLMMLFLPVCGAQGHAVVFSEYRLTYGEKGWMLSFQQKTSKLRDVIYAEKPDLRGEGLNSAAFLTATSDYIISNFELSHGQSSVKMIPQRMQYGGLKFDAQFLLEGLPENPGHLTMEVSGFDAHEHSISTVSITVGEDGYVNYFNEEKNKATFLFDSRDYVFSETLASSSGVKNLIYVAGFLILLVIGLYGYSHLQVAKLNKNVI